MKQITTTEELKHIGLDILLSVHEFCMRHHIMYSLACGTLIGAVRHKGFIPWDDDVDIYMLRDDYNKFITSFHDIKGSFRVISLETSKEWCLPYAKVYDTRTLQTELSNINVRGIGFGIDIFPIDAVPDSLSAWKWYEKKRVLLQRIFAIKKLKWREGRSLQENLFLYAIKTFLVPLPIRSLAQFINAYSQKYNNNSTSYLAENCFGNPNNRFSRNNFSHSVDLLFEGQYLKAMNGYDNYLKAFYGNYMELPPVEKRCSHHTFDVYWT